VTAEFDGIDADGDGVFKAGERVFRQDSARAAMAVDGDGMGCIIARYGFQSPAGILDFSAELRGKGTGEMIALRENYEEIVGVCIGVAGGCG
jgi:hypothetical protein